jgi:hypothetical protein
MLKRLWVYVAILLSLALAVCAYFSIESWRLRQETRRELEPTLIDWQEEKNQLLALGEIDLSPSRLTLSKLEQELKMPVLRRRGDFNTTRLAWVCGEEHCAIWATFLLPFGQDIPPDSVPAALIVDSPPLGEFPNIKIGEIYLGGPAQRLVQLSKDGVPGSGKQYHRITWDKDWSAAWAGTGGKASMLVFSNQTLLRPLQEGHRSLAQTTTK